MGVVKGTTGPIHGLNWNAADLDTGTDILFNEPPRVIEFVSLILLQQLAEQGIVAAATPRCQFNPTTKRITAPASGKPIYGIVDGQPIYMTEAYEESTTADSGTTTSLDAAGLATSDNAFWAGAWVIFTSGANSGEVRQVETYDDTAKRLAWPSNPLGSTVSAADAFVVTWFYVQTLTDSSANYIYGRESGQTLDYGVMHFVATVSSTPAAGDIFLATATLDGAGAVTVSSNTPDDADRKLYPGIGRYETDTDTYNIVALAGGQSVDFYITHDQYAYVGGREITSTLTNATLSLLEYWEDDRVKVRVTNDSSYSDTGVVTLTTKGRKLQTLS